MCNFENKYKKYQDVLGDKVIKPLSRTVSQEYAHRHINFFKIKISDKSRYDEYSICLIITSI